MRLTGLRYGPRTIGTEVAIWTVEPRRTRSRSCLEDLAFRRERFQLVAESREPKDDGLDERFQLCRVDFPETPRMDEQLLSSRAFPRIDQESRSVTTFPGIDQGLRTHERDPGDGNERRQVSVIPSRRMGGAFDPSAGPPLLFQDSAPVARRLCRRSQSEETPLRDGSRTRAVSRAAQRRPEVPDDAE